MDTALPSLVCTRGLSKGKAKIQYVCLHLSTETFMATSTEWDSHRHLQTPVSSVERLLSFCSCILKVLTNLHSHRTNIFQGFCRQQSMKLFRYEVPVHHWMCQSQKSHWCNSSTPHWGHYLSVFCCAARWPSKPQQRLECICFSSYELWTQLALLFMNYYWSACLHRIVAGTNAFTV